MGCTAGVQFPAWIRDFSLFHSVQTGSEAHSAFYPMGGVLSPGAKRLGPKADQSSRSSVDSLSVFMAWFLIKGRGIFI
jgi:hypothetical protein